MEENHTLAVGVLPLIFSHGLTVGAPVRRNVHDTPSMNKNLDTESVPYKNGYITWKFRFPVLLVSQKSCA